MIPFGGSFGSPQELARTGSKCTAFLMNLHFSSAQAAVCKNPLGRSTGAKTSRNARISTTSETVRTQGTWRAADLTPRPSHWASLHHSSSVRMGVPY